MGNPDAEHPLPRWLSGVGFVLLSLAAIVLGLGAPGLGWGLATVTMVAASLCFRLVGRAWLCVCLALAAIHVLTVGPLGGGAGSSFGDNRFIGAVLAAFPFLAGAGGLVAAHVRSRK